MHRGKPRCPTGGTGAVQQLAFPAYLLTEHFPPGSHRAKLAVMKYFWVLISILAVIAGTVTGEVSRKISYGWVESKDASLQVLGAGGADLRCMNGACRVCFDSASVPQLRDNVCHSTPGAMVFQPFVASAVTASVLLAFWLLGRRLRPKSPVSPAQA